MKIATWNVNSLKVRLPQVLDWLAHNPVDALCLQELKQTSEMFPLQPFQDIGYQACWAGQKTYNGVAIITYQTPQQVQVNNPLYTDIQQRLIATTLITDQGPLRLICVYCPNGSSLHSDKYTYKLAWFDALHQYIRNELTQYDKLVLTGDFNIAPENRDMHDGYNGDILVSPAEREEFEKLLNLGLHDSFRLFPQADKSYSWWDYRIAGFRRNAGIRIDHILLSDTLKTMCQECTIDKEPRRNEKPSDHTPVIATLKLSLLNLPNT